MRKFLLLASVLAISASMTYCSDEDSSVINDNSTQNSFSTETNPVARGTRQGVLYTYNTPQEFIANAPEPLKQIVLDDNLYLTQNSSTTDIINIIDSRNGEGLLMEKHYINKTTGRIVRSLILNTNDFTYTETNVNVPLNGDPVNDLVVGCPQGSTFLGSCSSINGSLAYSLCVGQIAANFALDNSTAGCSRIKQVTSLFSSTFCGMECTN